MRENTRAWYSAAPLLLLAIESALLLPLTASEYLRFQYTQQLARWSAKVVPPKTVFIGDSITAGARVFQNWRDINLGANGLRAYQVAQNLPVALSYSPEHIVVMAGTNDAFFGRTDLADLHSVWHQLCDDKRVLVTLPPPNASDTIDRELAKLEQVIQAECKGRPILNLAELGDRHGRLQARYTVDGTHLNAEGNAVWSEKLRRMGI